MKEFFPTLDEAEYCEDCDRHVSDEHWDIVCHCDDPCVGRTLAKGTPGEKSFCGNCGKALPTGLT